MNKLSCLLLAMFIAAALFAITSWRKAQAIASDRGSLHAKIHQLESSLGQAQSAADDAAQQSNFSNANKLELMRLRNEVSQLRTSHQKIASLETELAQFRAQNTELRTAANTPAPDQPASGVRPGFTRDQWNYSGNNTPEAALLSGLAAMAATPNHPLAGATGVQILERHQPSPGELRLKLYFEGAGELKSVTLHQHGAEWQMSEPAAPQENADSIAVYRRNPELMRRYFPHLVNDQQPLDSGCRTGAERGLHYA